jgi:hypothetical protein
LRKNLQREVEEELQCHIDMQAQDFEKEGLSVHTAYARARQRFGDSAKIKRECISILVESTVSARIIKLLFRMSLLSGVLMRLVTSDFRQKQIGNMLIAIGVLGVLLLLSIRTSIVELLVPQRNQRIDFYRAARGDRGRDQPDDR